MDDVVSDFSVFHRVDDVEALSGPRFFRLASRLVYYQGAVQARVMEQAAKEQPSRPAVQTGGPGAQADRVVDLTPTAIAMDPALAGLFSYAKSGG